MYTIATRDRAADITAHVAQKIEEGAGWLAGKPDYWTEEDENEIPLSSYIYTIKCMIEIEHRKRSCATTKSELLSINLLELM